MDSETRPADGASAQKPAAAAKPRKRGFGSKLEEGRQTFQPGLWSRLIGIGVVLIYLLLFAVLNTRHVRVSFVFTSTTVSLIWVILLSLGIGLVLGVLISQLHRFRMRHAR